jgi:hypothetical protein
MDATSGFDKVTSIKPYVPAQPEAHEVATLVLRASRPIADMLTEAVGDEGSKVRTVARDWLKIADQPDETLTTRVEAVYGVFELAESIAQLPNKPFFKRNLRRLKFSHLSSEVELFVGPEKAQYDAGIISQFDALRKPMHSLLRETLERASSTDPLRQWELNLLPPDQARFAQQFRAERAVLATHVDPSSPRDKNHLQVIVNGTTVTNRTLSDDKPFWEPFRPDRGFRNT